MKRKVLVLLFCLLGCAVIAQQPVADSLSRLLRNTHDDPVRVRLLNQLSRELSDAEPEKSLAMATQARDLAHKIGAGLDEGDAYMNLGNHYVVTGAYDKAAESFSAARNLYQAEADATRSEESRTGLGRALGSLGIVYSEQSNYARALHFDLLAIRVFEDMGDKTRLAKMYNNTGIVYRSLKQDFKALDFFVKAIALQKKEPTSSVGITMTNVGNIYLAKGDFPKALDYYRKAEAIFDADPNGRGRGELLNNLGQYYLKTGDAEKAESMWLSALSTFRSINDTFGSGDTQAYLGKLYLQKKQYDKALIHATSALESSKALEIPEQQVIAYKLLSDIYKARNDIPKAFEYHVKYTTAKDSLESHDRIRQSVQSEMNYEFEKREARSHEQAEKARLIQDESAKRHLLLTVFIGILLLLAAGIAFLYFSRNQLKRTLTLEKELAEYEQKALHLQMNPHFVFNCLGSISSFIVQNGTDQAIKYLAKFSKLMRLTLEYSKEQLIPIDREIEGLQNYLELEQLRFNHIFDFEIVKSPEVEDAVALPPLLLQPFVENAVIHGIVPKKSGGFVSVHFDIDGTFLRCTVKDNGVGIKKSQSQKEGSVPVHKSMALDITRKRLEMMQNVTAKPADMQVLETADDRGNITGTTVILRLPLQYND